MGAKEGRRTAVSPGEMGRTERTSLKERLQRLRDALLTDLIEREEAMRLVLLAALAGEHTLLIGPPGTAKSEVAHRLHLAFRLDGEQGGYFERLLTRFTVPEELFGPLSIQALDDDRYERKTERYLPTASVAFIDEVFKANSAILNALLTLLNEREFDNGSERVKTPLISVVGASNELHKGEELDALYDRFLVRYRVEAVSPDGFGHLLDLRGNALPSIPEDVRLTPAELRAIQEHAEAKVRVPPSVKGLLEAMRAFLIEQQIEVSDRRWRKIVKLLQVAAYTDGRDEVSSWDVWLVQHCAWQKAPDQRKLVVDWYHSRLGTRTPSEPGQFASITAAWEANLEKDRTSQTQQRDAQGRLLYLDEDGKVSTESKSRVQALNKDGEALFVAPSGTSDPTNSGKGYTEQDLQNKRSYGHFRLSGTELETYFEDPKSWLTKDVKNAPAMGPTAYSDFHVEGRVRQVEDLVSLVTTHVAGVDAEVASLQAIIDGHLWIPKGFSETALASLREVRERTDGYRKRLEAIRDGFKALPREGAHAPAV